MRGNRHYVHLALMTALTFVSMYILMYAMVDRLANVYSNLNQFYMAGLMTAPIVVIELALMRSVYDNKNANIVMTPMAACWRIPRKKATETDNADCSLSAVDKLGQFPSRIKHTRFYSRGWHVENVRDLVDRPVVVINQVDDLAMLDR
jgi:hypothetical protein